MNLGSMDLDWLNLKIVHDVSDDHLVSLFDLRNHLITCDESFVPRLSSYVDIDEYVLKLYDFAKKIAIVDAGRIIALGAYYITNRNCGFITNISVDPLFQSSGLGKRLLSLIEQELTAAGIQQLELEVFDGNSKAMRFYLSCGYDVRNFGGGKASLCKCL